jgi:urease accessory protein UreE|tara:strand:- start:436 stop:1059 length:624 start_codon:yes stop_codon:yes gene_type:complete
MDNFDFKKYVSEGKIHQDLTEKKEDSKKGNKEEQKRMEGAIRDNEIHIDKLNKDKKADKKKLAKLKADEPKDISENARTDAEEEGYKDGIKDEKEDIKKMKVSELKAKIREDILSELALTEEEEVDVDVDFEDEVDVDVEGDDIEIDRPAVKAKVNVGLSPEEEIIQDSLKAAMDAADSLGNDKLADQIGNTITFFTREYVVGRNDG